MTDNEKIMMKLFIKMYKNYTGKGPRNIVLNDQDKVINVNVLFTKAPQIEFIYTHFEDGEKFLTDMTRRVVHYLVKEFENDFFQEFGYKIKLMNFELDAKAEKCMFAFEKML